jgi:hypothetical protein
MARKKHAPRGGGVKREDLEDWGNLPNVLSEKVRHSNCARANGSFVIIPNNKASTRSNSYKEHRNNKKNDEQIKDEVCQATEKINGAQEFVHFPTLPFLVVRSSLIISYLVYTSH